MYFNRKNAEQKNWRMIKKGKHFLFGCSLVFAVGASLATQVVHANTAETTVPNNSTTGDVNPTPNGDGKTYEAPAAVAEIKPEVTTTPAVAAKLDGETAKEVKALDKTKLENYIAEIEAKLANGTYDNKTEESVAVLKADLEAAKATLANATTQDEITKAYNKLVTTANTKLKNKPVAKKETPAVDTTNGKETVGKTAENTEKKSESNSIENTGSNDPRNGKGLDKNNAFRAEVAYSEGTNAAANGHSDAYILNDVNRYTSTDDAVNVVSRVTNYKVKYNKDASGKITSLDWLVFYNDHAENLANVYNTDGGDVYRNFIQIPAEVNMPTSITRAKYNSPINPKFINGKVQRIKPDGSALSNSVTFENPAPATAAGLPLDKKDTFALASGWESTLYGRSIEKLAGQEDRYFKSASSDSSPRTKELVYGAALNDKRLIVDRSTTGGSGYDGYVWSFRTAVPETTTNEQLKDMKVVFGMMRSATAGANAGFANIATNPVKMWQSDISTPTAKDQTVKVGAKPDATKSIGNFDTLPQGTTVKYKDTVDTKTPGEKPATVVVTYPDTSTKEVPVKVIVEKEAVAPAKPVTPKPEAPKPSTPAAGAATNKPAAGAATNKPAAEAETRGPEIVNDLAGKASTPADVTVKAPAGSTVKLYNTDGVVIGEAVANAQGVATVHPTNSLPAGEITATSTPAGGKESAKSAPITVTASPVTVKDGGVTGNNDTRLLVSKSEITVYPGDNIDIDVVAQATALEKFSVEKNPTAIKGVVPSGGYLGSSNGATIRQRDAKYSGTVAMDQPAGTTEVVFHAKNRDKPTTIYRALIVNVLETAKKYEPVAGKKVDVADSNNLSGDDKSKVIAAVKAANPSLPADSQYSVDEKGNLTITYPDGSTDKIAAAYLVNKTAPAVSAVAPTVEIPYSNKATKEVYVYGGEENSFDIKFKDDSGKIASATVNGGGNQPFKPVAGEENKINAQYGYTANKITAETPATDTNPAVITYRGTPAATDGLKQETLDAATKGENPQGMALGWRYATATDADGASIENRAVGSSNATDPGSFRVMLKPQTQKYDITIPAETEKVVVANPSAVTDAEFAKVKEKLKIEFSKTNNDANLAKDQGKNVEDKDAKIKTIEKVGNDLVVTYKDGSQDKKPLSEFVTKETAVVAPTVEVPYSNAAKRQIYVYTGENTDLTFTGKDETTVKDLYLRGPGGVTGVNAADYGFTVGKIDNGAVTNGEGTVSKDKRTATIKMTGVTTLKAPNQWTSFIEAKDSDDAKSMTGADYNATTDDAVRQQKPGYVNFIVKSQTDKYDIKAPTEKVAVADPANVTDEEFDTIKAKLKLEYNKSNDDANISKDADVADQNSKIASIEKDAKGNLVVTYTDGSKDTRPLSEFVGVAPTVEVPYSNADKRQIYVYTGENTDLTFTGKDETTVKDLYLRGPGGVTNDNATQYGFTVGKIDNGAVTNGEGTVSKDKRTATIKMTGVTNLKAPNQWTSFIEAKDNENIKSMTGADYNASTDDAVRQQKPGYVQFVVKSQTDKYDIKAPTEKVAVADPANVTEAELAKIKEKLQLEHKKDNDDANISKDAPVTDKDAKIKSVTKDNKGNLVVTYTDGSTDKKPLSEFVTKDTEAPAKPVVETDLTDKAGTKTPVEVTAEPGSKVELFDKDGNKIGEGTADENGKATITPTKDIPAGNVTAKATDPAGNVSEPSTPEKATADTTAPAKPEIKTDLTDKAGTKTPVEVTAEPGSKVELFDKDGNKLGEGVADENGKATITPTRELPAGDVTAKATDPAGNVSEPSVPATATKDTTAPAKPEVKTDLTDKAGTKTPVEVSAEPGSKVELFDKDGNKLGEGVADENGKATITPTKELPAGDVTAKATDPAGNVSEPSTPEKATADTTAPAKPEINTDLTDKAGTKTPVEVSAEPGSKVELFDKDGHKLGEGVADENGKATITPTRELPAGDVTAKATDPAGNVSEPSVPATATKDTTAPAKPEVKTDLTDKAGTKTPVEVSAEPGSKVELFDKDGHKLGEGVADENGKATITPTRELPAGDVTAKATDPAGNVSEPSVPATATKDTTAPAKPAVTPVVDPSNLTEAEKAKVADEVKKSNPTVTDVKVGQDGTTTVTFPDGSTAVIPSGDTVKKSSDNAVKDPAVTPVVDPSNLTEAEKAKVADEVKKSNPTVTDVKVGQDGTTTVTYPDGTTAVIPADKAVKKSSDNAVKDPAVTPVVDPSNLTEADKAKVADEVKKSNPTVTDVKVGQDGTTTVTYPDGTTAVIPSADTVKKSSDNAGNDVVKPADKTVVANPDKLTDAEKKAIEDKVKAVNPGATVVVDDKGNVTVTTPAGNTAVIPAADLTKSAEDAAKPNAGNDVVKPADKTVVANPDKLTDAEKKAIEDKVKAVNPGATVVVDDKGNVTVTTPAGNTAVIPAADLTKSSEDAAKPNAGNDVVKPADKTVVVNPDKLTGAEKKAIEDKVKAVNPGATVVVDDKGNTTVTTPAGNTAVIPAADLTKSSEDAAKPNAGNDVVKPADKTVVANPDKLTDAEKKAIKDKVKAVNPGATVVVDDKGNATVTTPAGNTAVIPAADLTKSAEDIFKQRPYVPSNGGGNNSGNGKGTSDNNAANNTDEKVNKAKLEGAIHQLDELIIKESAKLDAETAKEANDLLADAKKVFANADASQAEVDAMVKRIEDFMAKVSPSTDHVTPATAQAAANAGQTASAQVNARKAAKELPNTGTADSTVAMVAAAASALLGLGLAGRRRKEDEEA
ncbi:Ig-like domain-containing protein [Streptococcus mitis]|uniref:LPXTG-motif cell wall anchor domain protein n=1 Tax=Streptococcus mitis TaxID=28037 RepID=A0A081QS86_STRMT|nr:Ig-like domain-containing protein [Streptococcus mitis]KEQ45809.1 LPXTG-motif cell wall anchor domain protein [Streptococcus mitis]